MKLHIGRLFLALMAVLVLSPITLVNAKKDYARIDRELQQMHEAKLFKGGKDKGEGDGKGERAAFDKKAARAL